MIMDFFQIISSRLFLRPIQMKDANPIFLYRSDAFVNQYQGWIPKTIDDVHGFINNNVSKEINLQGTWFQFVIIKKDDNKLIGDIGVHFLHSDAFQVELGCTLHQKYHGNGYAFEAMSATINYLFDELGKQRLIASIDPRNGQSIQLFERLGFRKEAHFKQSFLMNGEWVDDLVFALLQDEWSAKK